MCCCYLDNSNCCYLSFFRCLYIYVWNPSIRSQQKCITPSPHHNNINRHCFAYDGWSIIFHYTANATTTRNLATFRHNVMTGLKQGGHTNRTHIADKPWNPRGYHYIYIYIRQTYSIRYLLRTLNTTTSLSCFKCERIPDQSNCSLSNHTLTL